MTAISEQIFKAGPSFIAIADIRWSAFNNIIAWTEFSICYLIISYLAKNSN